TTVRINKSGYTIFQLTSIWFSLPPQIECHISQKSATVVPLARTWLRAIGIINLWPRYATTLLYFPSKPHSTSSMHNNLPRYQQKVTPQKRQLRSKESNKLPV